MTNYSEFRNGKIINLETDNTLGIQTALKWIEANLTHTEGITLQGRNIITQGDEVTHGTVFGAFLMQQATQSPPTIIGTGGERPLAQTASYASLFSAKEGEKKELAIWLSTYKSTEQDLDSWLNDEFSHFCNDDEPILAIIKVLGFEMDVFRKHSTPDKLNKHKITERLQLIDETYDNYLQISSSDTHAETHSGDNPYCIVM